MPGLIWIIVEQESIVHSVQSGGGCLDIFARMFSKKTSRYCHRRLKTLTFSNTEDIYLNLRLVVYYQKVKPYH